MRASFLKDVLVFFFFGNDVLRVIYSDAFHAVFLWRVRFWLRMNAGGVLNTCKSNGILRLCLVVRVANG